MFHLFSDSFREGSTFQAALEKAPYLEYKCFDYVREFDKRLGQFEENGLWIMSKYKTVVKVNS